MVEIHYTRVQIWHQRSYNYRYFGHFTPVTIELERDPHQKCTATVLTQCERVAVVYTVVTVQRTPPEVKIVSLTSLSVRCDFDHIAGVDRHRRLRKHGRAYYQVDIVNVTADNIFTVIYSLQVRGTMHGFVAEEVPFR